MKTIKSGRSEQKHDYEVVKKTMNKYSLDHTIRRKLTKTQVLIFDKVKERKERSRQIPVKEFCLSLIEDRLSLIAKALPDDHYSMGSLIVLDAGKLQVKDDYRKEYSKSSNYSAKHGGYTVKIKMAELKNFKVIGGLVTYIYPNQKSKIKKCWWYTGSGTKQYFRLKKQEGFLYGDFHGLTIEEVREKINLDKEYKKLVAKTEKDKMRFVKGFNKFSRKQYGFQDSLDAGNCEPGTRAFVIRLRLDPNRKYRGTYLLKLAEEKSTASLYYIKRMIEYKMLKEKK